MPNQKGKVISESNIGGREVLTPRVPYIGETEINFICGNCNTMLVKGFNPAQYRNKAIRCMNCNKLNAV